MRNGVMTMKLAHELVRDVRRDLELYVMLALPLLALLLFAYVPMIGLVIAFQDYDVFEGFRGSNWVGFKHFLALFSLNEFPKVLGNTLIISFYKILFYYPVPILLAVMLNEVARSCFKRTVQTIVYLPHFMSWAIISGLVFDLLSSTGVFNTMITTLGGARVSFLTTPGYFRSIVVLSAIWKEAGYGAIVYLAAITGIDPTLYEAAKIDGAGRAKRIWHVTLPGITSVCVLMLILRLGTVMDANFEQMFTLLNPTVMDTGDVLSTYIYRNGLTQMRYSYSTAAGMFNSVVAFSLVFASNALSRRLVGRSIW